MGDICKLLRAWSDGEQGALEKLTPIVYDELPGVPQAKAEFAKLQSGHWQ